MTSVMREVTTPITCTTLVLPQVDENLDHDDHDDQCNEGGDHTYDHDDR